MADIKDPEENMQSEWRARKYDPLRKFMTVLSGLRFAVLSDFSVLYKVVLSAVILALTIYLRHWVDLLIILVVTAVMLTAELLNSAIETLCDFVHPTHEPRIGRVKDIAAAAAGVTIALWTSVLAYEYYSALNRLML